MSSKKQKPLSKSLSAKCGYCNTVVLKQNLPRHCSEVHQREAFAASDTRISNYFSSTTNIHQKRKRSSSSPSPPPEAEAPPDQKDDDSQPTALKDCTHNESINNTKLEEILDRVKDIQITVKSQHGAKKCILPPIAKPNDVAPADNRISQLQLSRSLHDIVEYFDELTLCKLSDSGFVICSLCCSDEIVAQAKASNILSQTNGVITFSSEDQLTFQTGEKLSKSFTNLKKKIMTHLENPTHAEKWVSWKKKEEEVTKLKSRNEEVGLRIARICYFLYKKGGSERDFEIEVLRKIEDGIDMGDINHSHNFPPKFRPFVAKVIHNRMSNFLKSRMVQTGNLPPINIGADKGTNKHRTRQFLTALTVVPDAEKLLQPIYIGQPIVKDHSGNGVALSIKGGLDGFGISSMQVEASSHDGQYYHLSVPEALCKLYSLGNRFVSTVDPLHKAGTVDTHIRKDATYTWMIKVFATCKEVFNKFNWGKNYELLVETCQELENNMAQLVTFQTTRFANVLSSTFVQIMKQ